jgi:hypothetical protein
MHQIAELHTAERIVAEILDDCAAVGVAVRLFELVLGERRKTSEKQRAELIGPNEIDDLFVGEYRVRGRANGA